MSVQILQARVESRKRAVDNLDHILIGMRASATRLNKQQLEHELQLRQRETEGTNHVRWTDWANDRLAGLIMQAKSIEEEIERVMMVIAGHETAIKEMNGQIAREMNSSNSRLICSIVLRPEDNRHVKSITTVMDLDRKPPTKKPNRRYVAKGERPKKMAATKQKNNKKVGQKNGRKQKRAA